MRELSGNGLFAAAEQQLPRIETLEYNQKNWKILFSSSSSSLLYSFFFLPPQGCAVGCGIGCKSNFFYFSFFSTATKTKKYIHTRKRE
jgi:hypothetical protein